MRQNQRQTPRQKMINLMYIVLTAMLALNVSSDVLDGFSEVEQGVSRSTDNATSRNEILFGSLADFASRNKDKGGVWHNKAKLVKAQSDSINNIIELLKLEIAKEAGGKECDITEIRSPENIDAASTVMLSPVNRKGEKLRKLIEQFRESLKTMHNDSLKQKAILSILSTDKTAGRDGVKKTWEEHKFDNKPAIAAITLLSQLQNDIRYAEGETLSELIKNIDAGEVRVNEMNALVIPQSKMVMRGSNYIADIVIAAVDSTQRPTVSVNGATLEAGQNRYSVTASGSGEVKYSGIVTVDHPDGTKSEHPFNSSYTVIDPMATVSATMMNVLYCGIDNPISISVPGVAQHEVYATINNGTIKRHGNGWIAHPEKAGTETVITVTAEINGTPYQVAQHKFKVRRLPDPTPYIAYTDAAGNPQECRNGAIPKHVLASSNGLNAAIDDGVLNIEFNVTGFEILFFDSMGNAMPEMSDGRKFSQRQKNAFKRLGRGKRFYISNVKAIGPDGIERNLSPLEVTIQ